MTQLSDNPDIMLEVIAKLVFKLGGSVTIHANDPPSGPYNVMSKLGEGCLMLVVENITADQVETLNNQVGSA